MRVRADRADLSDQVAAGDAPEEAADAAPTVGAGALGSFRAFPAFRLLWTANFVFFSGVWTQTLVLGWLVYDLTGSASLLGIFTTARLSPMLLGPLGGALADRMDRVTLLLVTQAFTAIVLSITTALVWLDVVAYWHLVLAGGMLGLGQAPTQPARFTLVMDIVGRAHLTNANALNAFALNSTMVLGPALGGVLLTTLGVTGALLLSLSWYVLACVVLLPLRGTAIPRAASSTESLLGSILRSAGIAMRSPNLRAVLFVSFTANVCVWPIYQGFLPVFAEDVFDVGASGLSWILVAGGSGMAVGSLLLASLGDFPRKGVIFAGGTGWYGLMIAAFALAPSFPLALACIFAAGFGAAAFGVLQSTLLLIAADEHLRGRLLGLQVLTIGVLPLATFVHGALVEAIGVAVTSAGAGLLLAVAMAALLLVSPGFRRLA